MSSEAPSKKRYRRDDGKNRNSDSEDDSYVPYVPVRERKKTELLRLGKLVNLNENSRNTSSENESDDEQSQEVLGRKYK